jgi:hypothetical protein
VATGAFEADLRGFSFGEDAGCGGKVARGEGCGEVGRRFQCVGVGSVLDVRLVRVSSSNCGLCDLWLRISCVLVSS